MLNLGFGQILTISTLVKTLIFLFSDLESTLNKCYVVRELQDLQDLQTGSQILPGVVLLLQTW